MKKILATILALVMVLSLSVTALADDTITSVTESNTSTGNVVVTVNEGVNTGTVYSVTVAWTDTAMEYQLEGEGTWNPLTHGYEDATAAGWVDDNNTASVKVTNHSNADVKATIEADVNNALTYEFSASSVTLATAVGRAVGEADNSTFIITATSEPTEVLQDAEQFIVTISTPVAEPVTYEVWGSDRWAEEGQTTFDDVAVNQVITFRIVNSYTDEEMAYVSGVSGQTENLELIPLTQGNNIKFTAAGTYVVTISMKTIDGDQDAGTIELTFTVT